jgi:hypothetical protein
MRAKGRDGVDRIEGWMGQMLNRNTVGRRISLGAVSALCLFGAVIVSSSVASASAKKSKSHPKKPAAKAPCLVGKWTATNFTLNDGGVTASGGAGTEVNIAANQEVTGIFTPGAPLTSGSETFKFSGTIMGKYGFSTKTKAKSGSFPVTYSNVSTFMLSLNGSPPKPAGSGATTGSYQCTGKGLYLSFPTGGNQVTYTLVPTK